CSEAFIYTTEQLKKSISELKEWSNPKFKDYISDAETLMGDVAINPDTCVSYLNESGEPKLASAVKDETSELTLLISDSLAVLKKLSLQ
ncbi:hypothetical protein KI387_022736, partial [Taxus chinensis]